MQRTRYRFFICYVHDTGGDFARHLKNSLEKRTIPAFLDDEDLPKESAKQTEWWKCRDDALRNSNTVLFLITAGFEESEQVIKEVSLTFDEGKQFMLLRHEDLDPKIFIDLPTKRINLGDYQQTSFDTKYDLTRKVLSANVHAMEGHPPKQNVRAKKTGIAIERWSPLPNIKFIVSQRLLRILTFPQVGWEAYNDSPYQLRVRIEVHPILGGRDLHPLSDDDINGIKAYEVEPKSYLFANGCFSLPQECSVSKEELILEIRATVEDINDPEKGQHNLVPRRWKYVREHNTWSYYPQRPMTDRPEIIEPLTYDPRFRHVEARLFYPPQISYEKGERDPRKNNPRHKLVLLIDLKEAYRVGTYAWNLIFEEKIRWHSEDDQDLEKWCEKEGYTLYKRDATEELLLKPYHKAEIVNRKESYKRGEAILFRTFFRGELINGFFSNQIFAPDSQTFSDRTNRVSIWAPDTLDDCYPNTKGKLNGYITHESRLSWTVPLDAPLGEYRIYMRIHNHFGPRNRPTIAETEEVFVVG
jgi:hypothetical protein